jgi:outer membrane lipoprotein
MRRRIQWYSLLVLSGFILGCAPVISPELRGGADSSITFKQVAQNPNHYEGKTALWGGEIIQTLPQENGTNLIEVLDWPLGWWDDPRETVAFHGKFLVLVKGPLDPSVYKRGKRITLTGEIQGEIQGNKIKELTDPTYRYPVVLNKELYVWKYPFYPYSSAPDFRTTWRYQRYDGILHY